jgi:hypothetical protein
MFIINIEKSPLRNKRYRVYLINGDHYDIGFKSCYYFIDHHDKSLRNFFYQMMSNAAKNKLKNVIPCELLYEAFILNGATKNIITNINFFNREILETKKVF